MLSYLQTPELALENYAATVEAWFKLLKLIGLTIHHLENSTGFHVPKPSTQPWNAFRRCFPVSCQEIWFGVMFRDGISLGKGEPSSGRR